jgi:hypothetical protein
LQIGVQCNTSAKQTVYLQASHSSAVSADSLVPLLRLQTQLAQEKPPYKINDAISQWIGAEFALLDSYGNSDWLLPSLQANDITAILFYYDGVTSLNIFNS